jgi:PhnB protein
MFMQNSSRVIEPYLFFNGRCEEAIAFYQKAIGAELTLSMRYEESPEEHPPGRLPPGFEKKIMHASLRVGGTVLMASDGCSSEPAQFAGFCLSLSLATQEEAGKCFAALTEGGTVHLPLGKTFWSPCFGMVQDKFGVGWMVTVESAEAK